MITPENLKSRILRMTAVVGVLAGGLVLPGMTEGLAVDCYTIDGQRVCAHDEGDESGTFHTYDYIVLPADSGAGRKMHVFLPHGYEGGDAHYPVVYFNDGQSVFFPNNDVRKTWRAAEALATLYREGAIDPVIVVAVYPIDREREYTHAAVLDHPCCGVAEYANYLADEMKPFIDRNYRTRPEARFTTIIGSSHGGLAAFYIATVRRDAFGAAGAMSSSFWVGMVPAGSETSLANSSLLDATSGGLEDKAQKPRLWLDWGLVRTGGLHNSFTEAQATRRGREMAELLRERFGYRDGSDLMTVEDRLGDHTEDSWARRLPGALRWLLRR